MVKFVTYPIINSLSKNSLFICSKLTLSNNINSGNKRYYPFSRFFFTSALHASLLGRALKKQIATVNLINPRDFTTDKHRTVDDVPYGGGVGMVLKPEPIFAAVESVPNIAPREVIMLTPQGQRMDQNLFKDLSTNYQQLILICGHYEGIDERVQHLVTREVSLGDFVLTGGEIPALTLMDGVIRLLPGTVGKKGFFGAG